MAKISEEVIVIKLSRLVRDSEDAAPAATPDIVTAIEQVTQELVGNAVIVEVESA
jgi:hypothetical protein